MLAFRYPDMETARHGWERVRDLIFFRDCDASVYRTQINGEAHVVIVGWTSVPGELRDHFERLCSGGCAAEIPETVRLYLIERRNTSAIPGAFWQRRGTS